jgi:uncharacterized membrane-anchored protein
MARLRHVDCIEDCPLSGVTRKIRAAGTAVGDFISGRNMLGLPVSTAVTGALFVALLVIWREQSRSEREIAIAS